MGYEKKRKATGGFFASLVAQDNKESACSAGDLGSVPGLGRSPGEGHGNLLQYSCLENPHGQRSLKSSSPWGRKELDMTKLRTKHTKRVILSIFT